MCERRTRKIRKGPHVSRLRETRRTQQLQRLLSPVVPTEALADAAVPCPNPPVDKTAQCRLILELALKTIVLMQKNNLIQQKIVALQKETSEFVASVMSNPENKRRYIEHVSVYGSFQVSSQVQKQQTTFTNHIALKLEPRV
ncbi:hypothetical protein O0L34_g3144 [Tuta absoluta]|nr:hypothetical protein O0L34_g3144 [Tuta absoluta]